MHNEPALKQIGTACAKIFGALAQDDAHFGLRGSRAACGAQVLFAELDTSESVRAGAFAASLCQGGLAQTGVYENTFGAQVLPFVRSKTDFPRLATLTLQSAIEFQGEMISGPIKLHLAETNEIRYDSDPASGSFCAVVQADEVPCEAWMVSLANAAHIPAERLTLLVAPQESMLGAAQIAGRMNENMIFTMERSMGLDSNIVASIEGFAPVCPPGTKSKNGTTLLPDDFLHYGAFSRLTLAQNTQIDSQRLANNLAFTSTDIFGSLFSDLLKEAGGDFFRIPNLLHINKLAVVEVIDAKSGQVYRAGSFRPDLL